MLARTEDERLFLTGFRSEYATGEGVETPYWKEATILDAASVSSGTVWDFADDGDGSYQLLRGPFYNYACGLNTNRKLGLSSSDQLYTGGFHRSHQTSFRAVALSRYGRCLWRRASDPDTVTMYGRNTNLGMSGSNVTSTYFNNTMTNVGDVTAMATTLFGATARAVRNNLYLRGHGQYYQQNSANTTNVSSNSRTYMLPNVASNYIVKIVAGNYHFLMLTAGGDVYSWGHNFYGQLGQGHREHSLISKVMSNAKDISASVWGSVVLTNDNEVYHFGIGVEGNVANPSAFNLSPFRMNAPNGEIEAAVSTYYGIALLINGFIYTKGRVVYGTLGTIGSDDWTRTDPSKI